MNQHVIEWEDGIITVYQDEDKGTWKYQLDYPPHDVRLILKGNARRAEYALGLAFQMLGKLMDIESVDELPQNFPAEIHVLSDA